MAAPKVDLGEYDGRPITLASVVIPAAGGGLNDGLAVSPVLLHTGDEVVIALRCRVADINHKVITHKGEDTGNYERVAKLVPSMGIFIDDATLTKSFAEQQRKIEEAAGIQQIPGISD